MYTERNIGLLLDTPSLKYAIKFVSMLPARQLTVSLGQQVKPG